MKKQRKPLSQGLDLWQERKVKLVLVNYQTGNVSGASANRFFFPNDGQLDDAMVLGVEALAPFTANGLAAAPEFCQLPQEMPYSPTLSDGFFLYLPVLASNIQASPFYVSLCDVFENYWWNRQAVGSLLPTNAGRYIKRTYNRIKLDKCFVEAPISIPITLANPNSTIKIPFLFHYATINK